MDYAETLEKIGIKEKDLISAGQFLLGLSIVQNALHTALALGFTAVKALVASVISFVIAHLGLILCIAAVVLLIILLANWLIDKYSKKD